MPTIQYKVLGYNKLNIKETNTTPNTIAPNISININKFSVIVYSNKPNNKDYKEDYSKNKFQAT